MRGPARPPFFFNEFTIVRKTLDEGNVKTNKRL
jgi:hypothetical protein